jgi:hypothetical protein
MKTLKRIPIIMIVFAFTLGPFYVVGKVIYLFIRFLIGYWKCGHCKKWYWAKDNREKGFDLSYYCDDCCKEERQYKKRPMVPKPPVSAKPSLIRHDREVVAKK